MSKSVKSTRLPRSRNLSTERLTECHTPDFAQVFSEENGSLNCFNRRVKPHSCVKVVIHIVLCRRKRGESQIKSK